MINNNNFCKQIGKLVCGLFGQCKKKRGFTLAEVLIAVGIVGIISLLVVPMVVTKIQTSMFNSGFRKSTVSILDELNQLPVNERLNISDGEFIKKYMKVS